MSHDCYVTIHDPARKGDWQRWIGTDTVPVRGASTHLVLFEGLGQRKAYLLAEQALTAEQRLALAQGIANKFGILPEEVEQAMYGIGVPILAESCSVTVYNPQRWA